MNPGTDSCACGTPFPDDARVDGDVYECRECGRKHSWNPMSQATALVTPPPAIESKAPADASPPPESLGPYQIENEIGRGGMGTVYRAKDSQLGRDVAVKVLAEMYRGVPDFSARFEREAKAAACINHRNIVQIYYTGEEGGVPFFGMELVSGRNLQDLVTERDFLSVEAAIDYMIQTAEGLRAAASQGIIHRDIKPTNLLVQSDGTLKIADFGLAKSGDFDSRLTITGAVVGTPYYMAPEQGKGEPIDHRADIYALGATFYHLLAGKPPFHADTPIGIIVKHINEEAPALRHFRDDVPPPVEAIINKMMAKDSHDRYEDYDALIADLAASRTGSLIHASATANPSHREKPVSSTSSTPSPSKTTSSKFVVVDPTPDEFHLKKAGVFRWLFATAIDLMILFGLERISLVTWKWLEDMGTVESEFYPVRWAIVGAASICYFIFLDALGGQTVGKAFFRLRIGTVDGTNIGFLRSLARFVLISPFIVSVGVIYIANEQFRTRAVQAEDITMFSHTFVVLCIYMLLDLIYAFTTRDRRFLHDSVSGTYVYRQIPAIKQAPPIPSPPPSKSPTPKAPTPPRDEGADSDSAPETDSSVHAESTRDSKEERARRTHAAKYHRRKSSKHYPSPRVAALLAIIPGMGQVYNGQFFLGLLVACSVTLLLVFGIGLFIWIYSIWHAHNHAATARKKANHSQSSLLDSTQSS